LTALTTLVTAGSPMNTLNLMIGFSGATPRARSASPSWTTITSASSGIEFTGVCSTVTFCFFS